MGKLCFDVDDSLTSEELNHLKKKINHKIEFYTLDLKINKRKCDLG
jgi:septin family protein